MSSESKPTQKKTILVNRYHILVMFIFTFCFLFGANLFCISHKSNEYMQCATTSFSTPFCNSEKYTLHTKGKSDLNGINKENDSLQVNNFKLDILDMEKSELVKKSDKARQFTFQNDKLFFQDNALYLFVLDCIFSEYNEHNCFDELDFVFDKKVGQR